MLTNNKGYRCMKCEGKNVREHGRYCPNRKNNMDKMLARVKQQTDEVYDEKEEGIIMTGCPDEMEDIWERKSTQKGGDQNRKNNNED